MEWNKKAMELRTKIFIELNKLEFKPSYLWRFQQVLAFRDKLPTKYEAKELFNELDKMCNENIFIKVPYLSKTYNYRLTDKGYQLMAKFKS